MRDFELLKPGDKWLITCFFLIAFTMWWLCAPSPYGSISSVEIMDISGGRRNEEIPLKGERTVSVEGILGTTIVELRPDGVRILSSPCPNRTCVGMGFIDHPGAALVCVPNGVFLRIEGDRNETSLDAITR